jgi:hypothetical protein
VTSVELDPLILKPDKGNAFDSIDNKNATKSKRAAICFILWLGKGRKTGSGFSGSRAWKGANLRPH